jgi:hypothetical protein
MIVFGMTLETGSHTLTICEGECMNRLFIVIAALSVGVSSVACKPRTFSEGKTASAGTVGQGMRTISCKADPYNGQSIVIKTALAEPASGEVRGAATAEITADQSMQTVTNTPLVLSKQDSAFGYNMKFGDGRFVNVFRLESEFTGPAVLKVGAEPVILLCSVRAGTVGGIPEPIAGGSSSTGSIPDGIAPAKPSPTGSIPDGIAPATPSPAAGSSSRCYALGAGVACNTADGYRKVYDCPNHGYRCVKP